MPKSRILVQRRPPGSGSSHRMFSGLRSRWDDARAMRVYQSVQRLLCDVHRLRDRERAPRLQLCLEGVAGERLGDQVRTHRLGEPEVDDAKQVLVPEISEHAPLAQETARELLALVGLRRAEQLHHDLVTERTVTNQVDRAHPTARDRLHMFVRRRRELGDQIFFSPRHRHRAPQAEAYAEKTSSRSRSFFVRGNAARRIWEESRESADLWRWHTVLYLLPDASAISLSSRSSK